LLDAMQFTLRELLILLAVGPPTFAVVWLSAPYLTAFVGSLLMRMAGCCSS
jgi:hypothetical protein